MIIAVAADTHGETQALIKRLLPIHPDHLLFAGDFYRDGQKIARWLKVPANIVAGNCDFNRRLQNEELVTLLNRKILLVHGHQYRVKRDLNQLYYRAQELEADAVVFGHTHDSFCEKIDGIWMINPGSPLKPRYAKTGSFAIIEIDSKDFKPAILEIAD